MIAPMSETSAPECLTFAEQLSQQASKIALSALGNVKVSRKADKSVVTETDHAIQSLILSAIAQSYPDHAVCAEETIRHPESFAPRTEARYCWVIDPLDGTRNYTEGFRAFSTAIALLDRGVPIVAVVREHNLDHLYSAIRGEGARCNGQPVRVQDRPDGADVLVAIPSSKDAHAVAVIQNWSTTRGLIFRNLGSTALHLAMVASNVLGAVLSTRAKIWDIAAGVLLVEEAGGTITDTNGNALTPFDLSVNSQLDLPFLAGTPKTHARLLDGVKPKMSN